MKIYFDLSSIKSGHKLRGIGFYTKHLWTNLSVLQNKHLQILEFDKTNKFDNKSLYHFPAFSPFFFSFPLQYIKQSIITIHDLIPLQYPQHFPVGIKGTIRWQVQKNFLKFAKHIITDSKSSKKQIIKLLNIPNSKISVVYLAANKRCKLIKDKKTLKATINKYNLPNKFLLYVGDLNWNKNIMMLAKTAVKLKYPLYIVGKQASKEPQNLMHPWNIEWAKFTAYAKQHPNLIIRLGFIPDHELIELYNLATVYVHPAIEEGFGLPILEAMQCGCPVICGNKSSMAEIAGNNALLFNPTDGWDLHKKLRFIWNDSKLRLELQNKGLIRAKQFSWIKTAQQTIEVYKNI